MLEIPSNTVEMMWHVVQVQAVVDDVMESDIPQESLSIGGVTTEDKPLHPEQPTCSKDCPTDITETDRGDFEMDTDPFPNTLEDDGVPVYP